MMYEIFAVHDSDVSVYGPPVINRNAAEAIRSFKNGVANPKTDVFKHPEHFTLVRLGTYDDDSGVIEYHTPQIIITAGSIKESLDG